LRQFHLLTEKYLEEEKRNHIIAGIEKLEDVDNIAVLADLVR